MCQLGNYFNDFPKLNSDRGRSKRENKRMNKNVKLGREQKGILLFFFNCVLVAVEITRTHTPEVKGYGSHRGQSLPKRP